MRDFLNLSITYTEYRRFNLRDNPAAQGKTINSKHLFYNAITRNRYVKINRGYE